MSQVHTTVGCMKTAAAKATVIEFNPEWKNGTGYLDGAVEGEFAPKLEAGEVATCLDNFGRLVVMVGTPFGNVVVFTRFNNWQEDENSVVVFNGPTEVTQYFLDISSALKPADIENIFGLNCSPNVGKKLKILQKCFVKLAA